MEGAPLASFEFRRGELAGSHLSLFDTRLVHRSAGHFEAMPLDHVVSVGAGFERDPGRISLGGVLIVIAIVLFAVFWPLRTLLAATIGEVSAQAQGGAFLPAALRVIDFFVALLPFASVVLLLWASACIALGWVGETVMRVTSGASEKVYATRGRDPLLFELAESVAMLVAKRR